MPIEPVELCGRRAFVVEDEWMVSELVQDMLVELGYKIAGTASRMEEAVSKSKSVDFDIAVLDVNLNGQMTFPLAEALASRGIAFVFLTGYGQSIFPDAFKTRPVLQKPFLQPELKRILETALA